MLLRNRADINICNEKGASPLFIACQNGHQRTVQLFLSFGADPNICENINVFPFACQNGHDAIVNNLIQYGAYVKYYNNRVSPIYIACQNGHYSIVEILIKNGTAVKECKKKGMSAINIAGQNGYSEIVHLLLSYGADINECRIKGKSFYFIANFNGHYGIVDVIVCKSHFRTSARIPCEHEMDPPYYESLEKRKMIRSPCRLFNLCFKKLDIDLLFLTLVKGHYLYDLRGCSDA